MKSLMVLVVCALLLGVAIGAQSDADYQSWMKSSRAAATSLGKNLDAKAGDATAMAAQTLQHNMTKIAAYWQTKNVSDAVKSAQDAKSGLKVFVLGYVAFVLSEINQTLKEARDAVRREPQHI